MNVGKFIEFGKSNGKKAQIAEKNSQYYSYVTVPPNSDGADDPVNIPFPNRVIPMSELLPSQQDKAGILQPHPADCSIYDHPLEWTIHTPEQIDLNPYDAEGIFEYIIARNDAVQRYTHPNYNPKDLT